MMLMIMTAIALAVNGALFLALSLQYRRLAKLNFALTWLCLNSMALRHQWKAQIYGLLAVVSKEDLVKLARE